MTVLQGPPKESPSAEAMTGPTEKTMGNKHSRCISLTALTGLGPAQRLLNVRILVCVVAFHLVATVDIHRE